MHAIGNFMIKNALAMKLKLEIEFKEKLKFSQFLFCVFENIEI